MAKQSEYVKCSCNSEFDICDYIGKLKRLRINHIHIDDKGQFDGICDSCGFAYYYDPQWENMMFDLKSMNQM